MPFGAGIYTDIDRAMSSPELVEAPAANLLGNPMRNGAAQGLRIKQNGQRAQHVSICLEARIKVLKVVLSLISS